MTPAERLRALLAEPGLLVVPGCFDGLSARLVERSGARAAYMTGFGTAATHGLPDTGLLSFGEMSARAALIAGATDLPLIADADTGYGGPANVHRTVRTYARAGVAAIQIEDQVWPKRCGHTEGRRVVSLEDAVHRIRAAVDARDAGHDILIVARTDARDPEGLEAALERCRAFAAAGADIVFPEALANADEMAAAARCVDAPVMVNLIEGGSTPLLARGELEAMGFRIAIQPLTLLYAAAAAMEAQLGTVGDIATWSGAMTFAGLRDAVGFGEHDGASGASRRREGKDA